MSQTTNAQTNDENLIGPFAVVPKLDCSHVGSRAYTLPQSARRVNGEQPPCTDCGSTQENWACLQENCHHIGCSRYQGKHMLTHHESSGHNICLSLSDHSVYCYACESYIDSPQLRELNQQLASASQ